MKRAGTSRSSSPWTRRTAAVTRATAASGSSELEPPGRAIDAELAANPRDRPRDRPVRRQGQERRRHFRRARQVVPGHLARLGEGRLEPDGADARASRRELQGDRGAGRAGVDPEPVGIDAEALPRGVDRQSEVFLLEEPEREDRSAALAVGPQVREQDVVSERESAQRVRLPLARVAALAVEEKRTWPACRALRARRRSRRARPATGGFRDGEGRPRPGPLASRAARSSSYRSGVGPSPRDDRSRSASSRAAK